MIKRSDGQTTVTPVHVGESIWLGLFANILTFRTAVVLPPEAVHVSSRWLSAGLDADQLKRYVLEPGSPVQSLFPFDQTDFELIPNHVAALEASGDLQYNCLITVSKRLTDRLIETIKITGNELLFVGSSVMGLMRLARFALINLTNKEVILIIELLADYSHIMVASASAPICCDRLTAIREFPASPKNVDSEDRAEVTNVVKAICTLEHHYFVDLDLDYPLLLLQVWHQVWSWLCSSFLPSSFSFKFFTIPCIHSKKLFFSNNPSYFEFLAFCIAASNSNFCFSRCFAVYSASLLTATSSNAPHWPTPELLRDLGHHQEVARLTNFVILLHFLLCQLQQLHHHKLVC
jgi:hypothetical protein